MSTFYCKFDILLSESPIKARFLGTITTFFPVYSQSPKEISTIIPSAMRYQPNTLKSCFLI